MSSRSSTRNVGPSRRTLRFTRALEQAENSTRIVQTGNHALLSPVDRSTNVFIYHQITAMAELDPSTAPASYQLQAPSGLGGYRNWLDSVSAGVAADGGTIEAWNFPGNSGFLGMPASLVQSMAEIISAGVAPITSAPDDGAALGFIAPAFVTAASSTAHFTGTDAVLLGTAATQSCAPSSWPARPPHWK